MFRIHEDKFLVRKSRMTTRLEAFWDKHYKKCVIICYWLLGLCNNFAYVIMLSAANDILAVDEKNITDHYITTNATTPIYDQNFRQKVSISNKTNKYDCNDLSTGTILIADIIPGIISKFIAPFFMHKMKYSYRLVVVVLANIASFLLVALVPSEIKWLIFVGVGSASFASSLGEITFLSMTTLYSRSLSIAGWASGTGAAGFIGSFGYAGLTSIGLSPRSTMLSMLVIPVLMTFSYIMLPSIEFASSRTNRDLDDYSATDHDDDKNSDTISVSSSEGLISTTSSANRRNYSACNCMKKIVETLRITRPLLKYMIPLFFVYFAEYFINQGLFELLYFPDSFVKEHNLQYRWYNVCYQAAVFISRSSIHFFKVKFLPIFPIFQVLNVLIALSQVYYGYFPGIWMAFILIFWEGLLGGGCYVKVSVEVPKKDREYSIAITSIADSLGIALAGFSAIPTHNAFCDYGNK